MVSICDFSADDRTAMVLQRCEAEVRKAGKGGRAAGAVDGLQPRVDRAERLLAALKKDDAEAVANAFCCRQAVDVACHHTRQSAGRRRQLPDAAAALPTQRSAGGAEGAEHHAGDDGLLGTWYISDESSYTIAEVDGRLNFKLEGAGEGTLQPTWGLEILDRARSRAGEATWSFAAVLPPLSNGGGGGRLRGGWRGTKKAEAGSGAGSAELVETFASRA
eukprot:gene3030-11497_t